MAPFPYLQVDVAKDPHYRLQGIVRLSQDMASPPRYFTTSPVAPYRPTLLPTPWCGPQQLRQDGQHNLPHRGCDPIGA